MGIDLISRQTEKGYFTSRRDFIDALAIVPFYPIGPHF
jgi:hypothetical protein